MALNTSESRVHIQSRGEIVDFWRIRRDNTSISHQSHPKESVDKILSESSEVAYESLRESEINLGLSVATAAILFMEAIKERSKKLAAISLVPAVGVVFSARNVKKHKEEIGWLEKETLKWEDHPDNTTLAPRE